MANNDGRSFGVDSEYDFINGLGEWAEKNRIRDLPYETWLRWYIEAHKKSGRKHHRAGVLFAQDKLARIKAKK